MDMLLLNTHNNSGQSWIMGLPLLTTLIQYSDLWYLMHTYKVSGNDTVNWFRISENR